MRIVVKAKHFRCSPAHRGCALPRLQPGVYTGLFEKSKSRVGYDRFVLPDGRIIPLLGDRPQHLKDFACALQRPHRRHYHGQCPAGPVYCSGGDYWDPPVQAELVVVQTEERLYRVWYRCHPQGRVWMGSDIRCPNCGEAGEDPVPWSFGGVQAFHPREGKYSRLLLLDEDEKGVIEGLDNVLSVEIYSRDGGDLNA